MVEHSNLSNLSRRPGDIVLSFGKHRGRTIQQVDNGYLEWMRATVESSWWREVACQALDERKRAGTQSKKRMLLDELKACSSLQRGKEIHLQAMQTGNLCIYVSTALVKMYANCGCMADARRVFDTIEQPNVVSWTVLITGYADNGEANTALDLFNNMKHRGCEPNSFSFVAALKACTCLAEDGTRKAECLERGRRIHSLSGRHSDMHLQNCLINMYGKCGSMSEARKVFNSVRNPDVVSWTALILGYADNGEGDTALSLFSQMKSRNCQPNALTIVAALKACTSLAEESGGARRKECLVKGREVHSEVRDRCDIYVKVTLINMYAKCGSMAEARVVFESIERPNVVSWTSLISGYADEGDSATALGLFARMKTQGCLPDSLSFVAVLKACTSLELVKEMHLQVGCHLNLHVQNTLISMYAKRGSMPEAQQVFDNIKHPNVVSWNPLILGYADNGESLIALDLFEKMKSQGCSPNSFTFVGALKACGSLAVDQEGCSRAECLERGKMLHSEAGCHLDIYVQNALLSMYAKCGSMADAHQVFESMRCPDVISWNALIVGYAENGDGATALNLFARMNCEPDSVTFVAALKACSLVGALETGRRIHTAMEMGPEGMASLISCYSKCGSIVEAQMVFDSYPDIRDLRTWTCLLAGYSRLGDHKAVFRLFEGMQDAGFQPDGVTLLCILTCCSHAGLVDKASELFDSMPTKYGLTPAVEHYNCMIDMLSRSNKQDDAMALFQRMPYPPNAVTFMSVLGTNA